MGVRWVEDCDGQVIALTGDRLSRCDFERLLPRMRTLLLRHKRVRLLLFLNTLPDWTADEWQDFDRTELQSVDRLAVVGDRPWEQAMYLFYEPFESARVSYFDYSEAVEAGEWIRDGVEPTNRPRELRRPV